MSRPKTKSELEKLSAENYEKLIGYIDGLPAQWTEREFPAGTLKRNIRDILAHLCHWHLMMLEWYKEGMSGKKPSMPAPGYTWKTVPELNKWINNKYKNWSLAKVRESLSQSHSSVLQLIEKHSDTELFEKKKYPWTGSTSLGAYLISSTSSHYDWAIKLIKKATKQW